MQPDFTTATISAEMPVKWAPSGDAPLFHDIHKVSDEARKIANVPNNETLLWGLLANAWNGFPKNALVCASVNNHASVGAICAITKESWRG